MFRSGFDIAICIFGTCNSSGGVVLASRDGKIVCENTLDARLDVAFRMKLPVVWKNKILYCIDCFL